MSKVVQLNVLVSSRPDATTYNRPETVASQPSVPGGTVTTYPHVITASFGGSDAPDAVEFYFKQGGRVTWLRTDEAAPFNYTVDDWATIRALFYDIYGRFPADPFSCKIAVKAISSEHVEWAQAGYTFGSS